MRKSKSFLWTLSLLIASLSGCKTTQVTNDNFSYEVAKDKRGETEVIVKLPYEKTSRVGLGVFLMELTKPTKQVKRLCLINEQAERVWEVVQDEKNEDLLIIEYGVVPRRYRQVFPANGISPRPLKANNSYLLKIETEAGESEMEVHIGQ